MAHSISHESVIVRRNESVESAEVSGYETLDVMGAPDALSTTAFTSLPVIEANRYHVLSEVGQGGVGKVRSVHDVHLDRVIALKELRCSGSSAEARFLREALITARLQHPAIVPIYEAGRWPSGDPFYTMKLVSGKTLLEAIDACQSPENRLALLPHVIAVADALAYAHQHRIIHRDIKPTNIILGEFGETVVIDWGVAKDLSNTADQPPDVFPEIRSDGPNDALTVAGAVIGTPSYMSPEQARGIVVDERADVYALGAILYHLLSGLPPYGGSSIQAVVEKVIAEPPVALEKRSPWVPADLLAIVHKAMARDLERRYRTAFEVVEDLRRFQTGQLVAAHRYTSLERMVRFAKRNRAVLAVVTSALVVLAIGATVSIQRIIEARERAERKQTEAENAEQRAISRADELTLAQAKASLDQDPTKSIALLKTLSPAWSNWGAVRTIAADAQSRGIARIFREHSAAVEDIVFSPDGNLLVSVGNDRRVIRRNLRTGESRVLLEGTDEMWRAAFSPDGKFLAAAGRDKRIHVWDLSNDSVRVFEGHTAPVTSLVFSPDGKLLASRGFQEKVRLWDVASGSSRVLSKTNESRKNTRGCVVFSPDGKTIAFADEGGVVLEDIENGKRQVLPDLAPGGVEIGFSPEGTHLVTGTDDGAVRLWNVTTKEPRLLYVHNGTRAPLVAFACHGLCIVSSGSTGTVYQWDVAKAALRQLGEHNGYIEKMAVSRNGNDFITAGADHTVRFWHITTHQSQMFQGFVGRATSVTISSDGSAIAGASGDASVRVWKTSPTATLARVGPIHWVAFAPNGTSFATLGEDGIVRKTILDAIAHDSSSRTLEWKGPINHATPPPAGISTEPPFIYSSDSALVAAAYENGIIRIFSEKTNIPLELDGHGVEAFDIDFSPNGKQLVAGYRGGTVRLWDIDSRQASEITAHNADVRAIAFSPDGKTVASGDMAGILRLTNSVDGTTRDLQGHQRSILHLAFTSDGSTLASASDDRTIRLWNLQTGQSTVQEVFGNAVRRFRFFADGNRFATTHGDSEVRIWTNQMQLQSFRADTPEFVDFAISPDGKRIATGVQNGSTWLWDLESWQGRQLDTHDGNGPNVSFGRDSRSVVGVHFDGTIQVWQDDLPTEPAALRAWLEAATQETVESMAPR